MKGSSYVAPQTILFPGHGPDRRLHGRLQAQTTLRFQFKDKEKLYYVVEQKTKSLLKILGQVDVNSNVNSTMAFYWEVVKLDQGNAQVRIKFTHSKMSMDSLLGMSRSIPKTRSLPNDATGKMLGQFNRVIAAMEITATMLPTGEMKDVKVAEATAKALKAIPSAELAGDLAHPDNFRDMLSSIVFSTEPVAKDKSWTYKSETYSPEGKLNTETVFTLEDTIQQDGAALEKISLKQNIKIVADPKAMIKVSSIKSSGHLLFDNKLGRFVGSTINQTKVGKIEVMGVGVDMNSDQTTVIRLAGQSADEKLELANKIESFKIDETEFVEKVVASQTLETIAGVARSFTVMRNYEPAIVDDQ